MNVASGSSKGCARDGQDQSINGVRPAYRIFLFASKLSGCLEIHAEIRELAFIVLAYVFDRIDMKRDCIPVNGKDDGLCLPIHKNLNGFRIRHNPK